MTNSIMKTSEVVSFNHRLFGNVRAIELDGKVLFCGKDVATALGYANTKDALARHCNGVVKRYPIVDSLGRTQEARFISEPDVIRLIVSSKLPKAQEFERWVFEEVIPSILKHGAYMTPAKLEEVLLNPDTIIQLATNLKAEQEKNKALTARIEADKPKTVFADAVAASTQCILVGDLAKILKKNDVKTGQNRLFAWLRENGYLHKTGSRKNMPTQRAMEMGLFEVKETAITHSDGHVSISFTTKVTGKGQQYFINKFLDKKRA